MNNNTPKTLRIIADIHGHTYRNKREPIDHNCIGRTYLSLIKDVDCSIQLGDLGWRDDLTCMSSVDHNKHKVIYGNHDDYDNILPHSLGDYGTVEHGGLKFFFIRGENSVDKMYRKDYGPNKSWWAQEELDWVELEKMVHLYEQEKPDIVLSHGCPSCIFPLGVITNTWKIAPSRTAKALTVAWMAHHPKLHIFAHHHNNITINHEGTRFMCLQELRYVDFMDGQLIHSIGQ